MSALETRVMAWWCNRCGSLMLLHQGEGGVYGWCCPKCDKDVSK